MAGDPCVRPASPLRRWLVPLPLVLLLVPIGAWSDQPRTEPSPEEIGRLVNQLGDDNFQTREEASKELVRLGKHALPLIESATESSDPEVRHRAWRVIDQWASKGQIPALLFQLSSGAPPVKAGAADSLGKMEGKAHKALPVLIKAAGDPTEIVRCSALEAVKKIQATLPVRLEVKHGTETIELDAATTFRIDVTNNGTAPATQVKVKVTVPESLNVTGVDGPIPTKRDGNRILSEPMTLEVNETRHLEVQAKGKQVGLVRVQVELTADGLNVPVVGEAGTTVTAPAPAPGK